MTSLCMVGYTYRGYPMRFAMERAREFGYQGIELRDFQDICLTTPEEMMDALSRATRLASELGLAIESVFYSPLPVSRDAARAAEERAFGEAIATLARFRIPLLHTRLSLVKENGTGEVVAAGAQEADYAAVRHTLQRIASIAEREGVLIAVEIHMDTIHDTAASLLRILSEQTSFALTATLDFANMLIGYRQEPLLDTIRAFGPRIGYVHLKNVKFPPSGGFDWNLPLRAGDINYYRALETLLEVGYDGPLAVEYCGTGDPDVFAEDDALYLRDLLTRLGACIETPP